jgi:protein-disulfide isomerase-like protein with CxxC motif
MEGKNFSLIGINSDKLERAQKAVKDNELNWRSFQNIQADGSKISKDWGVSGWPTLIVIDQNGEVVYRGHDGHKATDIAKKLVSAKKDLD